MRTATRSTELRQGPYSCRTPLARCSRSYRETTFGCPRCGLSHQHVQPANQLLTLPIITTGTAEKSFAKRLREVLEQSLLLVQYPRTLVQLVVQSLSSSPTQLVPPSSAIPPSFAAAFINATSLALINASSVPTRAVLCAVAVGKQKKSGELFLDPDPELGIWETSGCFAFLFANGDPGETVWADWYGSFQEAEVSTIFAPGCLVDKPSTYG